MLPSCPWNSARSFSDTKVPSDGEDILDLRSLPGQRHLLTVMGIPVWHSQVVALVDATGNEIQAVVDDINALIAAEGIYVLHVEAESISALVQAVRDAEEPPPWGPEAYVSGVCLLGATSGFGPVVELLGG